MATDITSPLQKISRADFLPFSPPSVSEEEIAAVVATMRSNWITTGPQAKQFEEEFTKYIGGQSSLALNSCTSALHVALAALDIGPGDEVITTPMTFVSTASVIEHVRATPILADVDPETLNIDPDRIAEKITPRTKAIIPVHFAGHPVEMGRVMELAKKHGLYVIEDAAHALPAAFEGRMVGTIGDFTAFSFYATKNLTTAEGGMLTGSPENIAKARILSLHGMSRDAWKRYSAEGSWFYEVIAPGFKYNMPDIQAAIGLVQLKRLATLQARREEVVAKYNAAFSLIPELQTPANRANVKHAHHLYVLRLNLDRLMIDRARFIEELKLRNIGSSVHFIPVHIHPYFRDTYSWKAEDFPVAYREYRRTVSLPLHPLLSETDVNDVIDAVTNIVDCFRR